MHMVYTLMLIFNKYIIYISQCNIFLIRHLLMNYFKRLLISLSWKL